MSAENILFHPSELGDLMSGVAKKWTVENSQTCKKRLVKIFREQAYDRRFSFSNKYTEKGLKMEETAITLYSLVTKKFLTKNTKRIENKYFTGEPDIIGKKETIDIKCSWSLKTFPHPDVDCPETNYEYQGRAYMDLTGSDRHIIAYCLVNAPGNLVVKEKEKLWYSLNCPDESNELYHNGKIEIEKDMIFDAAQFNRDNPNYDWDCKDWQYDIPEKERVVEYVVEYDILEMEKIYNRLIACRLWMNTHLYKPLLQSTN